MSNNFRKPQIIFSECPQGSIMLLLAADFSAFKRLNKTSLTKISVQFMFSAAPSFLFDMLHILSLSEFPLF
jgi:hypothetical protein